MCGRVAITIPKEELKYYFYNYFSIADFDILEYSPRYNIAPSQNVLSIINDGTKYRVGYLKWGFSNNQNSKTIINTRSETIDIKPSFKNSFINKRCLIPVDSFYEWKANNKKTPYRIMMKDGTVFLFAGIWTTFIKEDNSKVFSFSIITTQANSLVQELHERMPVILSIENAKIWLNNNLKDPKILKSLLLPYNPNNMIYYPVTSELNNPKNDYQN